jgi:hypothetical protein
MSSNDYLLLTKRGNKYRLAHRDADSDVEYGVWEFSRLEEALERAEEEQGMIEYGLRLGLKEEQK